MSFAIPLIEDLKKRRVEFASCGYFSRTNFSEKYIVRALQSGDNYDFNIRFGRDYPVSKAEFGAKLIEIEIIGGIPQIFPYECVIAYPENLKALVEYYGRPKREEIKNFRNYLKNRGCETVKFKKRG